MTREIPFIVSMQNQEFRMVGVEDYPAGKSGYLTVWESACPECGAAFRQKLAAVFRVGSIVRRCPAHRRPGVKVGEVAA